MILFNPFLKGLGSVLFFFIALWGLFSLFTGHSGSVLAWFGRLGLDAILFGMAYFLWDSARADYRVTQKIWHW